MDISKVKKDSSVIENGRWVDEIPGMGDLRLKVRGSGCKQAVVARQRKELAIPAANRQSNGTLELDDAMRVYSEIQHEVILLDWENMTSDGKPQPYDSDLAKQLLTNPDFIDFANAVQHASEVVDQTREVEKDTAGKPVPNTSDGKSSEATAQT